MTPVTASQLPLSLEPSVLDRWPTLREFIAHRVEVQAKLAKTIAAEMDLSPSALSRKLHPKPEDSARFTVDDLEGYLVSTGDLMAIQEYLSLKFARGGRDAQVTRAVAMIETVMPELAKAVAIIKREGAKR